MQLRSSMVVPHKYNDMIRDMYGGMGTNPMTLIFIYKAF